jgi:hypothetical protein
MIYPRMRELKPVRLAMSFAMTSVIVMGTLPAPAQRSQMETKLVGIQQAQATNKQSLAQYTWQETETISIKGNVKDTKIYQVRMGPDGQPQKTEISDQKAQSSGREGRLKKRVISKETEKYEQYGQEIAALAKQYTTPDPERLMQARQQGNISLQPGGNGTVSLVIKNYVKPGDSLTMTVDPQTHSPVSVQVQSYLNDPKDAVTISAQFAQLPDGTNHVASTEINGVSKHLTVVNQNSDYQHL